jgi:hypothetical protein
MNEPDDNPYRAPDTPPSPQRRSGWSLLRVALIGVLILVALCIALIAVCAVGLKTRQPG